MRSAAFTSPAHPMHTPPTPAAYPSNPHASGEARMPRHAWTSIAVACALLPACDRTPPPPPRTPPVELPRAGQPPDPAAMAAHIAGARMAALTGDQQAMQQHVAAMQHDMRRTMKLPDPNRRIDPEAARAAVQRIPDVPTVRWVDRGTLLVRVSDPTLRTQWMIDDVCRQLEPLGDTLAVVVHLQSATARTPSDADTLSRNCQLAPGDTALLQPRRDLDVLDPAIRARARADAQRLRTQPPPKPGKGDQAALEAIPEM